MTDWQWRDAINYEIYLLGMISHRMKEWASMADSDKPAISQHVKQAMASISDAYGSLVAAEDIISNDYRHSRANMPEFPDT